MTETHTKHNTNGVSATNKMSKVTKIVLTKTNARVTATQGETVALVANRRSNKICTRRLSSLFSLCLKAFGNSFCMMHNTHTFFFVSLFLFLYLFIFCVFTM